MPLQQRSYIVDEDGQKTAVILPIEQYEQMLEDLHDLIVMAEPRRDSVVNLEAIKDRIRAEGLI